MAATVLIREKNTAGETATDKTSGTIRLKEADNATVDINNPMVKPPSSTQRSFEKWLRLDITVGPAGSITSPTWYTDGSNSFGTGILLWVRTTNPGAFATPATPSNDSAGTNAFTYTSGSPKAMDAANAGPFTSTGDIADYLVMWMGIDNTCTAPQDPTSSETLTWAWNET